jgi:hypothetical protein
MDLPGESAGPYIRALCSGLRVLAPNEEQVPLAELLGHLEAMDPENTGELFSPCSLDPVTGLPALAWMERVLAQASLLSAPNHTGWSAEELARARRLDPELGARLSARAWMLRHLASAKLLPRTRLIVQQQTRGRREAYVLSLDRVIPSMGWMRLRLVAEGPAGWHQGKWRRLPDNTWLAEEWLHHLLSRHAITPMVILHQTLQDKLEAWVLQMSRGIIGPFWFPGSRPEPAPPSVFEGRLALNISSESMGLDIVQSAHRDPWIPPIPGEELPPGQCMFRDRRFAVSRDRVEAVRAWAVERGYPTIVEPIGD